MKYINFNRFPKVVEKNKNNSLLVWDSDKTVPKSVSTILLWRGGVLNENETCISLLKIIESDGENLRARYLDLIYSIGETILKHKTITEHLKIRENLSYWWLTLLAEKSVYKTNKSIEDSIRLMCLMKWVLNKSFVEIELVTSNKKLIEAFKLWCETAGIQFKSRSINESISSRQIFKWAVAKFPRSFKAVVILTLYLSARWQLKGIGRDRWEKSSSRTTFFSYSANFNETDAKKGIFSSGYWTKLPQLLKEKGYQSNWLHLFAVDGVIKSPENLKDLINLFNSSETVCQNHVTLDTFLSWSVIKNTLVDWIKIITKSRILNLKNRKFQYNQNIFWPLLTDVWSETIYGWPAVEVLLRLNLFEVALRNLTKQDLCVYLQENQPWELSLLTVWRSVGHGQTIGVPHSTVRFWDLRYHYDPRCYGAGKQLSLPQPNKIACNGKMALQMLTESGYPLKMLIEVEALRYLYLSKCKTLNKNLNSVACLLVVTDYVLDKTRRQVAMLFSALKIFEGSIKIIIKPHPLCPVVLGELSDERVEIKTDSLEGLLDQCTLVFSGGETSAAVEAYCRGIPLLMVPDSKNLNLSPLRGYKDVVLVNNYIDLANEIRRCLKLNPKSNFKKSLFFFGDNLERWQKIFVKKI